ncbi:MAG TPA: DegT/DnrJ/EryC1/StrS family aminotransferase [Geobacteraceae bacterium]
MKQVPMLDLNAEYAHMKADIDAALGRCLAHQKWILGPEVAELEQRIAAYLGSRNCIGCSSGTEALVLSLRALAIRRTGKEYFDREHEIVTTPFTFTATGDAILRAGATPVFVDIDRRTYNIDVAAVREYLQKGSKVVGIIPVHLYGQSCDMDALLETARERDLFVVEDVAQAFGASWSGKKLGSLGTLGAFSFFPSKNLGCFGDGGMVSTDDPELADLVRMLLKHGGKDKYNVDHIGYNARLDTIQAAVLLAKLRYIDDFNDRRRRIAASYTAALRQFPGIVPPAEPCPQAHHVYHQYTLGTARRDKLQSYLKDHGVSSMVYYPYPLHRMRVFGEGRSRAAGPLAQAEKAAGSVLSLPIEPLQAAEQTELILRCITDYIRKDGGE